MIPMNETSEKDSTPTQEEAREPGFWEVVMSVLAAALGVQTSKNRERDFTKGNPLGLYRSGTDLYDFVCADTDRRRESDSLAGLPTLKKLQGHRLDLASGHT